MVVREVVQSAEIKLNAKLPQPVPPVFSLAATMQHSEILSSKENHKKGMELSKFFFLSFLLSFSLWYCFSSSLNLVVEIHFYCVYFLIVLYENLKLGSSLIKWNKHN